MRLCVHCGLTADSAPLCVAQVISPTTDYLCAYPGDGGTRRQLSSGRQLKVNGGCGGPHSKGDARSGSLQSAMERQKFNFNEVVISSMSWDNDLPYIIDGFYVTTDKRIPHMDMVHRAFLEK